MTSPINGNGRIDSFLEQIRSCVETNGTHHLYRKPDLSYETKNPLLLSSKEWKELSGDALTEEAQLIYELAEETLPKASLEQRHQVALIQKEIVERLASLKRKSSLRSRGNREVFPPPVLSGDFFNKAENRLRYRGAYRTARLLLKRRRRRNEDRLSKARRLAKGTNERIINYHTNPNYLPSWQSLWIPAKGEPYIERGRLGSGAYKSVDLAQNLFSGSFMAKATEWFKDSFRVTLQEKEILKTFKGVEGIVQLEEVEDWRPNVMYTEYIKYTFSEILDRKATLPSKQVLLEGARQLAEGLKAIQKKGLYHNDLHSGNLMLQWDDKGEKIKARIIDFGQCSDRPYYCGSVNRETSVLLEHLLLLWEKSWPNAPHPFPSRGCSTDEIIKAAEDALINLNESNKNEAE